jgi:hypothetical protein
MISKAQRAYQNSTTHNRSLNLAVSIKISALINSDNKPGVIKIASRVDNLISEPKMLLISPKRDSIQR